MIDVDIEGDISDLQVLSPEAAQSLIDSNNNEREREAEAANAGGDMDDFRYLSPCWLMIDTNRGRFVATIKTASGGGRVSLPHNAKDFHNVQLSYELHARIQMDSPSTLEKGARPFESQQATSTNKKGEQRT